MCVLCLLVPTSAYAGPHKRRGGHHGGHGKRHGGGSTATTPAPADDTGSDTADTPTDDAAPDPGPGDIAGVGGAGGAIDAKETGGKNGKPKVFDFTGLDINGRLRTPQLLYFLERANEELDRASLEERSFIPEMVRTLDEERL